MSQQLVPIAYFNTEIEADHVRSMLEANGITTYVDGGSLDTMLSHLPVLGGVQLLSNSSDANEARQVIGEFQESVSPAAERWYCAECEETNDAGFEVCWDCGKDKQIVAGPSAPENKRTPSMDRSADVDAATVELEKTVNRAFRAALFGFVMLPFCWHVYSLYLLARTTQQLHKLSSDGQKTWRWAFLIDIIGCCMWSIFCRLLVFQ